MTTYATQSQSALDEGKAALVDALRDALGDTLRDVWVLDQRTQQPLYLREDVAERIEDVAVEKHLDNERYGFVTRQTYNLLHYSEFRYTHRGFDTWELFRTFVTDDDAQVGVVVGIDSNDTGYDFGALTDIVHDLADEYGAGAFAPVAPDDD
ncbi:DUF7522 family protein [Halobacterium sp. KA-6]|jgi:hypothetical protein|uniref:DUF7522 family protein n=1 Tax=Halobacterium sp. KA-6 TaxID=2896368 RepID=UPI001E48E3F2|nr:hypothetical protein [Halobacterium sp. KA-6]MCD2205048.1 hypothetical protein [Halobacterium sp. KA-6]